MIRVDKEKCIGCGLCAAICSQVFEMDDSNQKAKVKAQKNLPCVKDAITSCPVEAIKE